MAVAGPMHNGPGTELGLQAALQGTFQREMEPQPAEVGLLVMVSA